jgi:hypothetical protein
MSVRLQGYNLTHDEAKAHLLGVFESNRSYYGGVRVRCVAARYGSEWRNVLCVVHVSPTAAMPLKQESQHFAVVHLLEMWLQLPEYPVFLKKMPEVTHPWETPLHISESGGLQNVCTPMQKGPPEASGGPISWLNWKADGGTRTLDPWFTNVPPVAGKSRQQAARCG